MSSLTNSTLNDYHHIIKAQANEIASLKEHMHLDGVGKHRHAVILENQLRVRNNRCVELEAELERMMRKLADKEAECRNLWNLADDLTDEQEALHDRV